MAKITRGPRTPSHKVVELFLLCALLPKNRRAPRYVHRYFDAWAHYAGIRRRTLENWWTLFRRKELPHPRDLAELRRQLRRRRIEGKPRLALKGWERFALATSNRFP